MPPRNTVTAARSVSTVLPPKLHSLYEAYRDDNGLTPSEALRSLVAKGLGRTDLATIRRGAPPKTAENKGETETSEKS